MELILRPEEIINIAGAVLVLALGAFVARLKPRRAGNGAFAAYCVAFGLAIGLTNIVSPDRPGVTVMAWLASGALALVAAGALVKVALGFPEPLPRREWRLLRVPALAVLGYAAITILGTFIPAARDRIGPLFFAEGRASDALVVASFLINTLLAVWWGYLFLLRERYARTPADDHARRRTYRLLTVALVMFPAAFGGLWLAIPAVWFLGVASAVATVGLAVAWLVQAARDGGDRAARNVALTCLAVLLAAMLYEVAGWPGGFGLARTMSVALFAYAILRHQLLGIDLKVRWTIKQSTIGAVFIAVFFIVSEAAQQLFSGAAGPYIGIAAAGALVFALAPLQRVAERVANAAVPLAPAGSGAGLPRSDASPEETFRDAVRYTLRDGVVSPAEELHLARLADALGLSATRATELRLEALAARRARRRGALRR